MYPEQFYVTKQRNSLCFRITCLDLEKPDINVSNSSMHVENTLTLKCSAAGYPVPVFDFFRDGQLISNKTYAGQLTIHRSERETVNYTCKAYSLEKTHSSNEELVWICKEI